ncbi:dihydrodipicolinate synthase family protein [Olsenella sp. Marseille-P4559]|uniref:dihydrodipicolinate synthase family protein n=1 Tax=Olsenella sp. Marseille-P4559 TaxID=2364795 RepID=UPI001031014B|nr:dihydrodipicolinate synthase family protein [Olsenella sp. Marseille-P4559]
MSAFSGVIVPMVTPFRRDEGQTIDYEAGEQLVERLVAAGVSGIFAFGSNGEFHVCTPDERIGFSRFVVERAAGRVPVYVGTGSCSTREAVEMSKRAEDAGASAVSVVNPYFLRVSDAEVVGHYEAVAEGVGIPVLMYNIPRCTGANLSPEVVARVAEVDNVRGVKDSSGSMANLAAYVEAARGRGVDVLVGSDGMISAAHALGASGAVAGTANLIPGVVVGLWRALEAGDAGAAARLQAEVGPLRDVLHMGSVPQALKRALELAGVPVGPARRPVAEASPGLDERARAMLDHYGIAHG